MSSPDPVASASLREIARTAIEHGLRTGSPPAPDAGHLPPPLCEPGASFVTLRIRSELRGCTGSLEATRPLARDVALNAYRSAFEDPRFRPLGEVELPQLEIHVAVLSPLQPLPAASEAALLGALRPGIDGLVLREGSRGATFLPAVWESLPEPREFLDRLREKAGLPRGYWSPQLRFQRYTTSDAD